MKVRSGSIPKELVYILAAPEDIRITWDDTEEEDGDVIKSEKVFPTFVSDATNPGTLSTGRTWAKRTETRHSWVTVNGKSVSQTKQVWTVVEKTRPNDPIKKLRIFGLNIRYNGGRAWKCGDEEGHYFDLREDVLLDLMRTVGVSEGGYLNGEYVWAKVGAEMKLVRIGSELYDALVNSTARKEKKVLSKKELTPMHVYQQKNGNVHLYLGFATYFEAQMPKYDYRNTDPVLDHYTSWVNQVNDKNGYYANQFFKQNGNSWAEPPRPKRLEYPFKSVNDHIFLDINQIWNDAKSKEENFRVLESKKNSLLEMFEKDHEYKSMSTYSFSSEIVIGPSYKFVDDLGPLEVPGIWKQIREAALKYIVQLNPSEQLRGNPGNNRILTERYRVTTVAKMLPFGTLHPKSEDFDDSHDDWITMLISKEPT